MSPLSGSRCEWYKSGNTYSATLLYYASTGVEGGSAAADDEQKGCKTLQI